MTRIRNAALAASSIALFTIADARAGAFLSPNDLAVVRLGDGTAPLAGTGAQKVFIDEYDVSGAIPTLVNTVAVSSAGATALTLPRTSNHDGLLHLTTNGQYLLLPGYRADLGGSDPSTLAAATTPRVIGRIAANGAVDTSTALTSAYDATTIRAAASDNGLQFWVAGDNGSGGTPTGGTRYVANLGASTSTDLSQVQVTGGAKTPDNIRDLNIFSGQIYNASGSSSSVGKAAFKVGAGLPTSGSQTLTTLTTDGASVNSFYFADLSGAVPGLDTLYTSTSSNDMRKYSLVGGVWTANGTVSLLGVEAMTAFVNGSSVTFYGATLAGVSRLTDASGYNAALSGSMSAYITAPANTEFRGIAPAPAVPEPASTAMLSTGAALLIARRRGFRK